MTDKVKKDKRALNNFFEDDEDEFIARLNQGIRNPNGGSDSELSGLEDYEDTSIINP